MKKFYAVVTILVTLSFSNILNAQTASVPAVTTPAIFINFTATRVNHSVTLKWETVTEVNNTGFTIERNTTGKWEEIAFVRTKATNGNSNTLTPYEFTQSDNSRNIVQYRIHQVDFDGKFSYSPVRAVKGENTPMQTTVFPNPSSAGNVNVLFSTDAARNIELFDFAGRVVKQWKKYTATTLQITDMSPGLYTMRATGNEDGELVIEKILVNGR